MHPAFFNVSLQGLPGELGCGEACVVEGIQKHAAAATAGLQPAHDRGPLLPALHTDLHHAGDKS